jgi:hypothetical protein
MATFPVPPVDGSGGYAEILATDAVDSHVIRVHLAPFGLGTSLAAPFNYPYTTSHGSESGVNDTLQALMNVLRIGYDNTWGLAVANLFRNSGGQIGPVFPVPEAAQSGNNGLAPVQSYDIARATVNTFSLHTTNPAGRTRMVLKLPAWGAHHDELNSDTDTTGELPGLPQIVQGNVSGNIWQKVVAYLTELAAANGVRAHDGFQPQGIAKVSISENARLKRRYGFD